MPLFGFCGAKFGIIFGLSKFFRKKMRKNDFFLSEVGFSGGFGYICSVMKIILPRKVDGASEVLPEQAHQVLVIGANGAGKSRFTSRLAESAAAPVFRLSPLRALYGAFVADAPEGSIDWLYGRAQARMPFASVVSGAPATEAERLMALMLADEMQALLAFKVEGRRGDLPVTRIDRVLALWREIFPDNEVLRADGALMFMSAGDDVGRPQVKLSAGEKLVLYYFGGVLYAPPGAVIPIESPELFLHPSTLRRVWDRVESLRPDCTFVYTTHDLDFAATRSGATTIWVRGCDAEAQVFDYVVLPPDSPLREDMYMAILGARRPVLFIEGDNTHSIDSKLYPLIFPEHTVTALGSCDRVIESTRVFNSLEGFHHLDSMGIVDRDRRSEQEVAYLRRKKIMVPEVAEIENLLMVEGVVKAVAEVHRRDPQRVFQKVKEAVIAMFRGEMRQQALQHTRHQVKHIMEHRIDGRFASISKLEEHMADLVDEINPRAIYESKCREFSGYVHAGDYASVLRVYNQKSMVGQSNVGQLTGTGDKRGYLTAVLNILKTNSPAAERMRAALRAQIR